MGDRIFEGENVKELRGQCVGRSSRNTLNVPAVKFSNPVATSLTTFHLTINVVGIILLSYLCTSLGV